LPYPNTNEWASMPTRLKSSRNSSGAYLKSATRVTLPSSVNEYISSVLTTRPFSVQWKKVRPVLGVAVTVCKLPPKKVPPPLTTPSALGDALTSTVYSAGTTVRNASRNLFPWPLLVLMKLMLPEYVLGVSLSAMLRSISNVTVELRFQILAKQSASPARSQSSTLGFQPWR